MRTDAQQGVFLNIVVGIIGAALAGFLLSPPLGIPTINSGNFSISALLISLLGAVILRPSSMPFGVVARADAFHIL
jgi:uncharacterized membrane protein YeaQ/YmgE (transglycosylase-associated protein family)